MIDKFTINLKVDGEFDADELKTLIKQYITRKTGNNCTIHFKINSDLSDIGERNEAINTYRWKIFNKLFYNDAFDTPRANKEHEDKFKDLIFEGDYYYKFKNPNYVQAWGSECKYSEHSINRVMELLFWRDSWIYDIATHFYNTNYEKREAIMNLLGIEEGYGSTQEWQEVEKIIKKKRREKEWEKQQEALKEAEKSKREAKKMKRDADRGVTPIPATIPTATKTKNKNKYLTVNGRLVPNPDYNKE